MDWSLLDDWWLNEIQTDPAYETVVTPLVVDLLDPPEVGLYLDLGCGDGRVMRAIDTVGPTVHGLDLNETLARIAATSVVAELPGVPLADDVYDGVYSVLTLEHVEDHKTFFREAARVTKALGLFVLVTNHPAWTAPDSTPITDADGEVLWRPGGYFSSGSTDIPSGSETVTFHHRTTAELLTTAAAAGWSLEELIELPHHDFSDQSGIPRLLGCRWRLLP